MRTLEVPLEFSIVLGPPPRGPVVPQESSRLRGALRYHRKFPWYLGRPRGNLRYHRNFPWHLARLQGHLRCRRNFITSFFAPLRARINI